MNLQSLLQEFNPSKFVVYNCLLIFTMLLTLKLDETITISYWLVFMPLWIWKGLVILGALIGTIVWCRNPMYRLSDSSYIHFKSMLISLSLQLLLLMFELLACDKLESGRHLWILAFIPLIFISLLSIAICVWAMKNDRNFELELFCSANIIQFIFIAMRLDRFINWSWVVVFVPLWIVMCLSIIGVLYALIFAAVLLRTPDVAADQRKASIHTAISYSLIVVPLLVFLILLSNKLDNNIRKNSLPTLNMISTQQNYQTIPEMDYFSVCIPLYLTFIILICLSFGSKGGNSWWFGIRKDFCTFLLSTCPCLREYGNISYNKNPLNLSSVVNIHDQGDLTGSIDAIENASKLKEKLKTIKAQPIGPITPHITIETPD